MLLPRPFDFNVLSFPVIISALRIVIKGHLEVKLVWLSGSGDAYCSKRKNALTQCLQYLIPGTLIHKKSWLVKQVVRQRWWYVRRLGELHSQLTWVANTSDLSCITELHFLIPLTKALPIPTWHLNYDEYPPHKPPDSGPKVTAPDNHHLQHSQVSQPDPPYIMRQEKGSER